MTTPNKSIVVQIKNVFGTDKVYPLCVNAQSFAAIAGTETLTRETIKHIQALGYAVTIKQDVKTLANVFGE